MSMNSGRLILRQPLPNGLTLELWDHSRPVAGDRWYTALSTRIAIPVREDILPPDLKPLAEQIVAALGEEIIFTHKEERNFIDASAHGSLLKDMQDRILALVPDYFGHGDFAAKFIRRSYEAYQQRPK